MEKITVEKIMSWSPCSDYPEYKIRALIGDGKTPLEIANMENIPIKDRLWVLLRPEILPDKNLHEIACKFAEHVLPIYEDRYPNDNRPRKAIEAKRLWLDGKITTDKLSAFASAAYASAASASASAFASAAYASAAYASAASASAFASAAYASASASASASAAYASAAYASASASASAAYAAVEREYQLSLVVDEIKLIHGDK